MIHGINGPVVSLLGDPGFQMNEMVYVGAENLFNYKQPNPIIDASNPRGDNFDGSMVWGPVHGRKIYAGIRFNISRD